MQLNRNAAYEQLTTRIPANELSTLLKVSSALASTLDIAEVLQIAIESATDLLRLDSGAIYTLEQDGLNLGATTPPLPALFPHGLRRAQLCDHPHIKEAVESKAPIYLNDARTAALSTAEKMIVNTRHLISIIFFPLLLKENVTGVFIVGTTGKIRQFSDSEVDLCNILSFQVSLAVANAQLYKQAQQATVEISKAYDATLEGWSHVLDMRDRTTDVHTDRVADLTVSLARRIGIPETEMVDIRRGALLHDIGKMGIPDAILQKTGGLSEGELAVMQTHPDKAYQILSQIEHLTSATDIPYCHHEKWDGTGYPRQLKGEEIPLAVRIFAVVDVFDALTSDRPYRKAWTKEAAVEYIQKRSGKDFWPEAVRVFLELLRER